MYKIIRPMHFLHFIVVHCHLCFHCCRPSFSIWLSSQHVCQNVKVGSASSLLGLGLNLHHNKEWALSPLTLPPFFFLYQFYLHHKVTFQYPCRQKINQCVMALSISIKWAEWVNSSSLPRMQLLFGLNRQSLSHNGRLHC